MKARILPALALALSLCLAADADAQQQPVGSIVKVYSVSSPPDFHNPWQSYADAQNTGSGCVIDGNRILTNAHVVSDQTFLMVRRQGDSRKYVAKLKIVGHECDLAILEVDNPDFFKDSTALEIGELPKLQDSVTVLGYPVGGDNISVTEGVVSRIEPSVYSHSGRCLLSVQIDAAINPGNSGGPVMKDGKVVGVAFQGLSSGENIGFMVPAPVVKHFLKDVEDGVFDGFPDMDFSFANMENPAMREWASMKKGQSGILITHIPPAQAAKTELRENDVLMAIDGETLSNDGSVKFRDDEDIFFGYLVWGKYLGDTINLAILRDGKELELKQKLESDKQLVPLRSYDKLPSYYITGGLLFTPLTQNYIDAWGSMFKVPRSLLYFIDDGEVTPERDQIVVLSKVLADDVNVGYQGITYAVVEKVNGTKVKNLRHLISLVAATSGKFLRIELKGNEEVILDKDKALAATADILKRYRIGADRSQDLQDSAAAAVKSPGPLAAP